MMMSPPIRRGVRRRILLLWTAALVGLLPALAAPADETDDQLRFASELSQYGFPDFAEKVLALLERDQPGAVDRIQVAQAEVMIARRQFKEVEALLKTLPEASPKTDAIKLALANAYNAVGKIDEAKVYYDNFFKKYRGKPPTDEDLLRFYQDSAYRMVQMLETSGDYKGSLEAYALLLKTDLPKDVQRRVQIESAELYLKIAGEAEGDERKKALDQAWKICEKIQWEYDLWFGRSIPIMANVKLLRGDRKGAIDLVEDYKKDLSNIDKILRDNDIPRSLSPQAGARYLLGDLYYQDGRAAVQQKKADLAVALLSKALQEFYNVFVKYPDSDWGPEAGVKSDEIVTALRKLGKEPKLPAATGQDPAMARQAFKNAHNLYFQKKYDESIREFLRVLNQYPETKASAEALGTLLLCYGEKGDKLLVKTMASHLGERVSRSDTAAMNLLRIGKFYVDKSDPGMYYPLYDLYLDHFPQHEKADVVTWTLSGLAGKNGDTEREKAYLKRLMEEFPQSQYSSNARSKNAFQLYRDGNFEAALPELRAFVAGEQPGLKKAQGPFFIGTTLKELGQHDEALKEYGQLVKWLQGAENNPFRGGLDEDKVVELLQNGMFFIAYSLSKIQPAEAELASTRDKAIQFLDSLLEQYPDTAIAPTALRLKGALLLELGRDERAGQTFDLLSKKYPESSEGQNAFFFVVDSYIELGKLEKAREAFENMIKNASSYTPQQFVLVGDAMLGRAFATEAVRAYEQALKAAPEEERSIRERALFGLGKSRQQLGNYAEAVEPLETFKQAYPTSAYYYDVRFALGVVYRELGNYAKAVEELADVFRLSKDPVQQNRASLEYARVQAKADNLSDALAAYFRVSMLSDPTKTDVRPQVETALLEGIALARQMEKWADVVEQCDQFNQQFANHPSIEDIRQFRREANTKAGTLGGN